MTYANSYAFRDHRAMRIMIWIVGLMDFVGLFAVRRPVYARYSPHVFRDGHWVLAFKPYRPNEPEFEH